MLPDVCVDGWISHHRHTVFFQLNCIFAIVWDCPRWLYADRAGYWKRLNNTLFGNILPHASHVDAIDAICLFSINGHITLHCMNSVYYIIYSCHRWIYIYIYWLCTCFCLLVIQWPTTIRIIQWHWLNHLN